MDLSFFPFKKSHFHFCEFSFNFFTKYCLLLGVSKYIRGPIGLEKNGFPGLFFFSFLYIYNSKSIIFVLKSDSVKFKGVIGV